MAKHINDYNYNGDARDRMTFNLDNSNPSPKANNKKHIGLIILVVIIIAVVAIVVFGSAAKDKVEQHNAAQSAQNAEEIRSLINNQRYSEAKQEISSMSRSNSSLADSLSMELETAIVTLVDDRLNDYFSEFNYDEAYEYLEAACYEYGYNSLQAKLDNFEGEFIAHSLAIAEGNAAEKNYVAASAVIQQAKSIVGEDNEDLNLAYNEYSAHLSAYITEMDYMSCVNDVRDQSQLQDNVGNMYHNGFFMSRDISFIGDKGWYGEGSAEYYVQGKYETFSGTVAVPKGYESTNCSAYFEVYGDGNLLYTSPVMTKTSYPQSFEINIENVQILKISYPESNDRADMATIYDGLLTPIAE